MLISELVKKLQELKETYGDVPVNAIEPGITRQDGRFPIRKIEGVCIIENYDGNPTFVGLEI